ncbi:MAG TPA: hypothetical protein VG537_07690 [Candidatus Kapabacteria bacterium]|jgi:hypothetical protein|nr:hypothetical protein [Candidatus Kapabacteria bacterium]
MKKSNQSFEVTFGKSVLGLILLITIASCAQTPIQIRPYVPFPFSVFGASGSSNYAGYFYAEAMYGEGGDGVWGLNTSANADTYDTNGNPRGLTGRLFLGSDTLVLDHDYSVPHLSGWSSPQIWWIKDTDDIGTFRDTINPPSLCTISTPLQLMHNDSVSIDSGFTVTYSNPHSDSIRIIVATLPDLAHAIDTSIDLSQMVHSFMSPAFPGSSSGSYFISPGSLSGFPNKGILIVHVITENEKTSQHHGRQFYFCSAVDSHLCTFIKP